MGAWLHRLAIRKSLLYRRKNGRQQKLIGRFAARRGSKRWPGCPRPARLAALGRAERVGCAEAMARLPGRDVEILLLKYTEDWSYRRLAEHLGIAESALERGSTGPGSGSASSCAIARQRGTGMSFSQDDRKIAPLSDGLIDRLVDGELDDAARRAVLARLDTEPDGWRRCALAFLEDQAWREAVSVIADTAAIPAARADGVNAPIQPYAAATFRARRAGPRLAPAAIAAAVLLAFGAGWARRAPPRGGTARHGRAPVLAASQSSGVSREPRTNPPGTPSSAIEPILRRLPSRSVIPTSIVEKPARRLPLSQPLRKQLQEQGYRVERHQGLMSMDLENGRTVALPVDEVEVRYVGNRVY